LPAVREKAGQQTVTPTPAEETMKEKDCLFMVTGDRPKYVLAKDWAEAIKKWRHWVTGGDNAWQDSEGAQPSSIKLLAETAEIIS
jgi:hypothetical protein